MTSRNRSSPRVWKRSHAIQDEFVKNGKCDKCRTPLKNKTFKGVLLAYSTSKSYYKGWLCYQCAIDSSKTCKRIQVTYQDLDDYLWSKLFPKVPLDKRW